MLEQKIGISIIVPIYNVEPYLHRCVGSILTQDYTKLEIILVDDGSPDNCGAICDEYAGKDRRVKVIHQKNRGLFSLCIALMKYYILSGASNPSRSMHCSSTRLVRSSRAIQDALCS